jgi:hypothetical protein
MICYGWKWVFLMYTASYVKRTTIFYIHREHTRNATWFDFKNNKSDQHRPKQDQRSVEVHI